MQTHYHVQGDFMAVPVERHPTYTACHISPDCASTSQMARDKHPRREEDRYLAVDSSPKARAWDKAVSTFRDIVREQRRRSGNQLFGFTFEQPVTNAARRHAQILCMEQPVEDGGDGMLRCTVHNCALGGNVKKPLDIWASKLPEVVRNLHPDAPDPNDERIKYRCNGCHKHRQVRGRTHESVAFHPNLANLIALGISVQYA